MPDPVINQYQNEEGYPLDPELLTGLARTYQAQDRGFVYDKIFLPINTQGLCKVIGIDWRHTFDTNGDETFQDYYSHLVEKDNEMGCDTEPKDITQPVFSERVYDVKWYANKISLTSCCLQMCGIGSNELERMVRKSKFDALITNFLLKRERAGVDLLLGNDGATPPVWNAGWENGDATTLDSCDVEIDVEGVAFDMSVAGSICDKDFDIQTLIQNLQSDFTYTGPRTTMVLDRKALWALRRNNTLKGTGCVVPASTTSDIIMSEFGVSEIVVADAKFNAAALGVTPDLKKIWGKGFILLFQKGTAMVEDLQDGRTIMNFAVDLKKYDPYFRTFVKEEAGENGVEYLAYHYSYTPYIHNLEAGTLLYNVY